MVCGPMAYFLLGNKKDKARKNEFKSSAAGQGLDPDKIGLFQDNAIGIDSKQGKLFFTNNDYLTSIDLSEISGCSVSKSYSNENIHNQSTSVLKKVQLCLKTGIKEVNMPIFDLEKHPHPGDDLLTAYEWEKIINNSIKNSRS